MVFRRYSEHSKGYVKYEEHPNGDIMKIDSHNIDFPEDKFLSIGEIKEDVELYELQQVIQPFLHEGRI